MLKSFSRVIVRNRIWVAACTALLCLLSAVGLIYVRVNFDLASYLPKDAPSMLALEKLPSGIPNMKLYLPDVGLHEAAAKKAEIAALPHVQRVLFIDDETDVRALPESQIPQAVLDRYVGGGGALFTLTIDPHHYVAGVGAVRAAFPGAVMSGDAVNQAQVISVSMQEIGRIIPILLPVMVLILLVATRHYVEPALFLLTIGVAILLNEGTNVALREISFVTRASAAVLQMAVSIDYAVFLLHRFSECRGEGMGVEEAMAEAMTRSFSSVAASAMTTVFGFLALMLGRFRIGYDMGLVMAKGVLLSYLSVLIFLPAVAVMSARWIDRTRHRSFMPGFRRTSRLVARRGFPLMVLVLILLIPAFLSQYRNDFRYGTGGMHSENSVVKRQQKQIEALFGQHQQMVLMVKKGEMGRLKTLSDVLQGKPYMEDVQSYSTLVGTEIPTLAIPPDALRMLQTEEYDLVVCTVHSDSEGEKAFEIVRDIKKETAALYPDCHVLGENAVNLDLMETITGDSARVLLAGLLSIGLVLLLTFQSLSIPPILLLIIEGSIWINMAIPYLMGDSLNYIGYQIVSSVQLGATVDYGILLAQRYMEARKSLAPREASAEALHLSAGTVLPPAVILTFCGTLLGLVSTNGVISQMGLILGRGAFISAGMVLLVLPNVLRWLDPVIQKTTRLKKKG